MSAFLGPIHHWLFNKITLFESLEENINKDVIAKHGDKALEITEQMKKKYGEFIPKQPLENLIDTNNIHGWLQNKISIAETRQAATLKAFIDNLGAEVITILEKNYTQQGSEVGTIASQETDTSDAPSLYKALNNYLLEGMPCDNVNSVIMSEPQLLEWNAFGCLHKPYWDTVGMDSETMYNLRFSWIKAFVEKANSKYTYKNEVVSQGFVHKILEK